MLLPSEGGQLHPLASRPGDPALLESLASAYTTRAFSGGDPDRCRDVKSQAQAILEHLAAANPSNHATRVSLAYNLISSGLDQSAQGQHPTDLDRAVQMYREFDVESGSDSGSREALGIAQAWRAYALERLGDPAWQLDIRAARDLLAPIVVEHPDDQSASRGLSMCEGMIAIAQAKGDNPEGALATMREAVARDRSFVALDPDNSHSRLILASALLRTAQVQAILADRADASREQQLDHRRAAIAADLEVEELLTRGRTAEHLTPPESEKVSGAIAHRKEQQQILDRLNR